MQYLPGPRSTLVLFCLAAASMTAPAYTHAGNYTFVGRWSESGATTSGGVTTYPAEHGGSNEYDVCPPGQLSAMFPSAVVSGNIKQTCANLWVRLLESSQTLGHSSTRTRARDVSEDWDINFVDPAVNTHNFWFNWYDNQYSSPTNWDSPDVTRSGFPLVLTGGPRAGESILGNDRLLAVGDDNTLWLDTDGSLSIYNYPGGTLQSNPTITAFTNGAWNGQPLSGKVQYMVGYEEGKLYFVEGSSTLHVYNDSLVWQRTQTIALGHELAAYTLGDLVDNKVPGYTYVGWDLGPIVVGVTALRPLDHLEVTTAANMGTTGSSVGFAVRACANSTCTVLHTRGLSGSLVFSDGTTTAFAVPYGSSTVTVNVTLPSPPVSGHVVLSVSGLSTTPTGNPGLHCGLGESPTSGSSCQFGIALPLHHVSITTDAPSGLTCTSTAFTVSACANAACTQPYTAGVSGQLTLTGAGATVQPSSPIAFSIGSGSASTTALAHVTVSPGAGHVDVGTASLSVTPAGSPGTYCGWGMAASSTASCSFPVHTAALLLSVPDHEAEATSTLSVTAVKQATNTAECTPAFANVNRAVQFTCSYTNPGSGTLPVRVQGTALNSGQDPSAACAAGGAPVTLTFNAAGVATATLAYADAGRVRLAARYSGSGADAGLQMSGSTSFVSRPAALAFSGITPAPLMAGNPFAASITARNRAGQPTPNFGREDPAVPDFIRVTWNKHQPAGTGASSGTFGGTGSQTSTPLGSARLAGGVVNLNDLTWSEVGTGDLSASLVGGSYLSTGHDVTGTTGTAGAVGPFRPHHLDTAVTQSCGTFTFSGQPFSLTVTARNAQGHTTLNYDGSGSTSPHFARGITLSAAGNGAGSLSGSSIPASSFRAGSATGTPAFTFTHKLSSPTSVSIRATDADGVDSASGGTEGSLALRSGRIRVSNAFGKAGSPLQLPVQSQYWSGMDWVLNAADSCSMWQASAVALVDYTDVKGQPTANWSSSPSAVSISHGHGTLSLSPPAGGASGSVDVAINLGTTTTDRSCLNSHPRTVGASLSWLRAQTGSNGACAGPATHDRDPSARATFGIYAPENRRVIHRRSLF